jgi:hypothetical protein
MAFDFNFDPEKMKQESEDAQNQKALLQIGGQIAQNSQPQSAYELLTGKKVDRPDVKGMFDSAASSIQDPAERQAKLYQAYKTAKDAQNLQKQDQIEAVKKDPNSMQTKAARVMAQKYNLPVDENSTAYDIEQMLDPKKMLEVEAQSKVDFDKQKQLRQMEEGYKSKENAKNREHDLEKIALEKGLSDQNLPQNVYQAATYGRRVEDANKQISGLLAKGYDPTSLSTSLKNKYSPEFMKSEDTKLMEQAQRNFINAVLRRESGSAISASEFESGNQQYFPQQGDSPAVLAQKERNRDVALAGLKTEGAKAWDRVGGNIEGSGSQMANKYAPDVVAYAKNHGISPDQAQMIKDKRTGKTMVGGN